MTAYAARMGPDTFGLRTVRQLHYERIGDTPPPIIATEPQPFRNQTATYEYTLGY